MAFRAGFGWNHTQFALPQFLGDRGGAHHEAMGRRRREAPHAVFCRLVIPVVKDGEVFPVSAGDDSVLAALLVPWRVALGVQPLNLNRRRESITDRNAEQDDVFLLIVITAVGILLSLLFVWTYVTDDDSERSMLEMPLGGAAWNEPLGAPKQMPAEARQFGGQVTPMTL